MSRVRKMKFAALFLAVLSIIIASVIAILPFLVSTDAIRIRLAHDLSTWTGYNVQLHGPPHISIFPSLKVSLPGVTLTDSTDNSAALMDAEHIEVDLSLYNAILGKIRFSETRIINPRFIVDGPIKTVAGLFTSLSNSEGILGIAIREAEKLIKKNPKKPDSSQLLDQPFGRILVEGGTLVYRPSQEGKKEEISDINALIDWPQSTRSIALKASGRWHEALTNLTIKADEALLLMGGGTSPVRISINSNRGGLTFTGIACFAHKFLLDGRIASRSPGWDQSMAWIGGTNFFGAHIKTAVVWESFLKAQPDHIELNNIIFTLGSDNARGALEIAFQNNMPITTGSLAFETLDLNQFAPVFFPNKNTSADLSFLERFGLDMRLSTSSATLQNINISDLAASIQIRNGRLVFDIGNAQIFGGIARANAQLQRNKQSASILEMESRLSASNINIEQLQKALGKKLVLNTDVNLTISMRSIFPQWSSFLKNAYGNLAFDLGSGRLEDFSIRTFIERVNTGETFKLELTDNTSSSFEKVDSKAVIENGQIKFDFITLYFGQQSIDIYGKIDSLKNNLKLTGIIDLPRTVGGICTSIQCINKSLSPVQQFSIHGPWLKPVISPAAR
ncbi:MAG: AsmA protein [Candidatus Tokpelaia sp. JSC189]|nr:MAG: AsmA protein [Candidatus Tokpelaia sp. JSC189]